MIGGDGSEVVNDGSGNDTASLGADNDDVRPGSGNDVFNGGTGSDWNLFNRQSYADFWQLIDNYTGIDIDLAIKSAQDFGKLGMDVILTGRNGGGALCGDAGRDLVIDGSNSYVFVNTDNDTGAEMTITVLGVTSLIAEDFIL